LITAVTLLVGGAAGHGLATESTVQVQVIGGGQVTSDGGQITCGNGSKTCFYSTSATSGTVVLTAHDQGSSTFSDWDGCTSSSGNQCTVFLSGTDQEVTANFDTVPDPGTKTLAISVTGDPADTDSEIDGDGEACNVGDTAADCSDDEDTGSTLTMVETPGDGYIFAGWSGDCSGTARSCTLQMLTDHSIGAAFRKPKLTVTINGNGTVTGGGIACTSGSGTGCAADENAGDDVTLTATPPSGGSFTGWGGACSGSSAVCTVSMTADRSVTATFSGSSGGGGGTPTTYPLSVSVTGQGKVAGGGISCGDGSTTCSTNVNAGTSVTLTATPSTGATFTSWGGACTGSGRTCSVTMNAAKSVTAIFSGGSTATVQLSVSATGHGTVTGEGIICGNGKATCSAKVAQGSTVGLTATPARGATFTGWGGACTGVTPTCTLSMDDAKRVTAAFKGGSVRTPAGPASGLRKTGSAVVSRTGTGYDVTLRFHSSRRGRARVEALRAGRIQTRLAFTAAAGSATVGPFPVAKAGYYVFQLHLGAQTLNWEACLGRCGEHASSVPFTLTRVRPTVVDAGALWSFTLHFHSSLPSGVVVRVLRSGRLARQVSFPAPAGTITPGALLLSPGTYRIELSATDAVGRIRTLAWYALLP
jgi:hypothetical protein